MSVLCGGALYDYITIRSMRFGYRVIEPAEVGRWEGSLVQISLYKNWGGSAGLARQCAERAATLGLSHVLHPVGYSLLLPGDVETIRSVLEFSGEALLLHDERAPDGGRLEGRRLSQYIEALRSLRSEVRVSLENSEHSGDAQWFWREMGGSVTLDMGHMESFGLDSVEFVRGLPPDIVGRVEYVHMHHNNGPHGGITDHWPLEAGCRELLALRELLRLKHDVGVILELNERDEIGRNIELLKSLERETPG